MAKIFLDADFITIADIYLAYRKAKSEAFYDSFHPNAQSYAAFESNLQINIESLHSKILNNEQKWWEDIISLGDYLYVPKSIDDAKWASKQKVHYRSVDPNLDWEQRFKDNKEKRIKANYRLIIHPTVEYQIISALWILKVGHKYENVLDEKLCYGNRLRRKQAKKSLEDTKNRELNRDSIGLFSPYFTDYKKWRGEGLKAMKSLVQEGKTITAITMDLASFYHNISPNFMLRPSFLKTINIELNNDEKKFTSLLIESINNWYRNTPDFKTRIEGAIPVGLSASKIISNVLLYELDQQIFDNIQPAYYGRYVDDIFLVFESHTSLLTGESILTYISNKVSCLKINREKGTPPDLRVRLGYAFDSELKFTSSKQKIFSLSSEHGLDFINQISSQINAQSSEYRMLPEVPRDSVIMAEKTLLASPNASLVADALRKADVVSVRRLGFSLLLRDIERYSDDLSPRNWASVRDEFYGLVERYLLTPTGLFEFYNYFSRVFKIMIINDDFEYSKKFICKLYDCFNLITNTTYKKDDSSIKINSCKRYFFLILTESAMQASTNKNFSNWFQLRKVLIQLYDLSNLVARPTPRRKLIQLSKEILLTDFGIRPYKDYWYNAQDEDSKNITFPRTHSIIKTLRLVQLKEFISSTALKKPHWPALAFPTRPLSIQEIALVCPEVLKKPHLFRNSIFALRGARTLYAKNIGIHSDSEDDCYFSVPNKTPSKIYIALTNFETTQDQFKSALNGVPDRSLKRYEDVNNIINDILRAKIKPHYIVFPECSLPRRWAVNIASVLAKQDISLIAGLEYHTNISDKNTFKNDCLVSLTTNWPGYLSNLVFLQPKITPSHDEFHDLKTINKKLFTPEHKPPIFQHGKYQFGVVICSDLTAPMNRVRFQGKVDCLFVLEWNPDVKTFSFLVEGAAHDIHTFVVQVNNRAYGDSRVRAPYRLEYKRDSVRVKGGISNTYVIAEIDYMPLRMFQNTGIMNDKKSVFKPVPIGFKISSNRK
jgi:hypothetical protein